MTTKKILFITATRADFGKLKPLMHAVNMSPNFELFTFITGMHTLSCYGLTKTEVQNAGFRNLHVFMNQIVDEPMDLVLANTIIGLTRYVREYNPDLIVVHGDRVETLAGAIVGAFKCTLVAHIEGGERSGTLDELIRHSTSKLSHIHFVANEEAAYRLKQLGEDSKCIYVIGSPDIDVMLSPNLPTLNEVKTRYEIPYNQYAIAIFHPVVTELSELNEQISNFVSALLSSKINYIVIYPNNDEGCKEILKEYQRFTDNNRIRTFPSMRFEYFLTLLKNAEFIIGNSSSGIREAPVYGVYAINVGTRQNNRFNHDSILNVSCDESEILDAIEKIFRLPSIKPDTYFGTGESTKMFMDALENSEFWETPKQKEFIDVSPHLIRLNDAIGDKK